MEISFEVIAMSPGGYTPKFLCDTSNLHHEGWNRIVTNTEECSKRNEEYRCQVSIKQSWKCVLEQPRSQHTRSCLQASEYSSKNCSAKVVWIPTDLPEDRIEILKQHAMFNELEDEDADVFVLGIVDKYQNRPLISLVSCDYGSLPHGMAQQKSKRMIPILRYLQTTMSMKYFLRKTLVLLVMFNRRQGGET